MPGVNVMEAFTLLPDPQTNGGLLFSVKKDDAAIVKELLQQQKLALFTEPIGETIAEGEKRVFVK
jgi:selenide,water dikinase